MQFQITGMSRFGGAVVKRMGVSGGDDCICFPRQVLFDERVVHAVLKKTDMYRFLVVQL